MTRETKVRLGAVCVASALLLYFNLSLGRPWSQVCGLALLALFLFLGFR